MQRIKVCPSGALKSQHAPFFLGSNSDMFSLEIQTLEDPAQELGHTNNAPSEPSPRHAEAGQLES